MLLFYCCESCGLRLTGLAEQGSIPWMAVGLVAFFSVVAVRSYSRKLLDTTARRGEVSMRKTTGHAHVVAVSTLESLWAIGTSSIAGALPA